ncbi:MAG: hypothetical protein H7Z42_13030 [Roseiflexaceae bacterium]|nr:hypothetical protein [Roseiflexaceae bacterium]
MHMMSLFQRLRARMWLLWGLSLNQWGMITSQRWFYTGAIGAFSRAANAWPGFAEAYLWRGVVRSRELGEPAEGLRDLDTALLNAPDWAEAYLRRGLLCRFHGLPSEAASDLRRFLALDLHSPWRGEAERQLAQLQIEHEE